MLCNRYVGETDLGQLNQVEITRAFSLPLNVSYLDYFSMKRMQKYENIIKKAFDLDIQKFLNLSPFYLQSFMAAKVLNLDYEVSLDYFLYQTALKNNMVTIGLETVDEQFRIAKSLDINIQMKMFAEICRNPLSFRNQTIRAIELYADNHLEKIYHLSRTNLGHLRKILIFERNFIMADRICDYSRQESSFISVGAGHLSGNHGLLAILKRKGLNIKPIIK